MTVEIDKVKEIYNCNGVTTEFAITFPIFDQVDVIACLIDSAGTETTLVRNTDYTVTLTTPASLPSLGHIDLLIPAPVSGNKIALYMDHDYSQEVIITNYGPLPASSINEANDRAVLLLLQLLDKINRSLLLPRKSSISGLTIPEPVADRFLRWKDDLSGLENMDISLIGSLSVSDFAKTLLDDQDASATLSTLGVSTYIKTLLDDADAATARQTLGAIGHALATAANDFLVASGSGTFVKKTLAETLTILGKGAVSGLATLNASSKVIEDPANATATPTASKIPIADGSAKLDTWVSDASATVKGKVELATDTETQTGTDTVRAITPANLSARTATETRTGIAELATVAEAIAGTDTARIVTPVGLAAAAANYKNALAFSQGINMTAAASGSNGIQVMDNDNIDFGVGSFTLVWQGCLPDWTPIASVFFLNKYQDSGHTIEFYKSASQYIRLGLNGTYWTASVQDTFADGSIHELAVVVTVGGSNTTVDFYADGVLIGVQQTAANVGSVSNTGALYISGQATTRVASTTYHIYAFNRALTATDVLALYLNGIAEADKYGKQTPIYNSNFTAGVDGFGTNYTTLASNQTVGGEAGWLTITANASSGFHYAGKALPIPVRSGQRVRVSFKYYTPSSNSVGTGIYVMLGNSYTQFGGTLTTKDAINTYSGEAVVTETGPLVVYIAPPSLWQDTGGDDWTAIKDIVITNVGAVLALEPEGIQPAPGQWLDASSNKLHALKPPDGSSLIRPKRDFEIRWTNTWAGTHEAQYIGGVNQAILPPGCYIESIIGIISGATIEDIIIGNGSDNDWWVTITTGLAAGIVAFILANRISDGTNFKMVVDPDGNFAGSITWVIKGIIL